MTESGKKKDKEQSEADKGSETAPKSGVTEIPVGDGDREPAPVTAEETGPEPEVQVEPDPVRALEARVSELEDQRLRALAELDNYRKRMARQFDEVIRSANDRLLSELLEVVDNFERALEHTNNDKADAARLAALREGTELIYNQLRGLLERYDVTPIESIGRPFDPRYHEALMQADSDEYDEGMVTAEISKGYMLGDRVLRHARVAVSKGKSEGKDTE